MKSLVACACLAIICLSMSVAHAEMRIWTLSNGDYFQGELVTFSGIQDGDSIRLRTVSGDQNYQLQNLSEEDQLYVRDTISQFQYSHGRSSRTSSQYGRRSYYNYTVEKPSLSPIFTFIDHDGRMATMPIPANSTDAEIAAEQLAQSEQIAPAQDKRMYKDIRSGRHSVSVKEWRRMTNIQKRQKHRQHEVWKLAEDRRNKLVHAQRMALIPADAKRRAEVEDEEERLRQRRAQVEEEERAARKADAAWNQADIDRHRMNNAANEAARAKWRAENTSMAQDQFDMRARQAEASRQDAERKWRESESRRLQAESDLHLQRMNSSW